MQGDKTWNNRIIPFIHNLMKAIQCCLIYDCGKQAEQVSAMVLKGNLMA
jgi:hypothetical protein